MNRILKFSTNKSADREAKKFASRFNGCVLWPLALLLLTLVVAILYPLFPRPGSSPHRRNLAISNIRQLGTSLLIYQSDYDDRYPHATAMPGHRASILPYCKYSSLFLPTKQSTAPEFNFNHAGTSLDQIPIGYTNPLKQEETTVWYALSTVKDKPGVFRSHSDSSARFSPLLPFFESFQYQFDRTGVILAPTDYLADQDPIKESK